MQFGAWIVILLWNGWSFLSIPFYEFEKVQLNFAECRWIFNFILKWRTTHAWNVAIAMPNDTICTGVSSIVLDSSSRFCQILDLIPYWILYWIFILLGRLGRISELVESSQKFSSHSWTERSVWYGCQLLGSIWAIRLCEKLLLGCKIGEISDKRTMGANFQVYGDTASSVRCISNYHRIYILCFPESSAPVERVFAKAKKVWKHASSQLQISTDNCTMQVKCNMEWSCVKFFKVLKSRPELLRKISTHDENWELRIHNCEKKNQKHLMRMEKWVSIVYEWTYKLNIPFEWSLKRS